VRQTGGGTIPNGADNAIVNNGGTVLINPADPNWTVNDIRAGDGSGNTGAWQQDGPTVTSTAVPSGSAVHRFLHF